MVIVTVERHGLLAPELADELYRLAQPGETLAIVRPLDAESALVEVLAGADAEDHALWEQLAERAEGLGHDRRVIAERRRVHGSSKQDAFGPLADRGEPCESKRRVTV